jgi:hypothetical protein
LVASYLSSLKAIATNDIAKLCNFCARPYSYYYILSIGSNAKAITCPPKNIKLNVIILTLKFMKYLKITFINAATKLKVRENCKDLTN